MTDLDTAIKAVQQQFGKGSLMKMDDAPLPVEAISTGAMTLDKALGIGGVPKGRIVEIYGPESTGKTTLIYHIMANSEGPCAFIDTEHAFDPAYAETIGVDMEKLYMAQPSTGEEALEIADTLIRSGQFEVIAIDSVAAMVPRAELEGAMGDSTIGLQARMMSQAMRKLAGNVSKTNTLCIFTNQIREKVGVIYGSPETQPGGRALKFFSSQRIDLRKKDQLKDGANIIGIKVQCKVTKNKVAPPFKLAIVDLIFGKGFDQIGSLLDVASDQEVVQKSGAWYSYGDAQIGQGREKAIKFLEDNPETVSVIKEQISI